MTSHIHVKIVEKIEIFRNLADIVHVWNPDWLFFFFINLSNSQYTSDLHQNISHQMKCIWQISSKNTKHGQFNTNANANQIQIQQQTRVSFEYDWNHTVQVTHVYFRINDFFPNNLAQKQMAFTNFMIHYSITITYMYLLCTKQLSTCSNIAPHQNPCNPCHNTWWAL